MANPFTGHIMRGDTQVAKISNDKLISITPAAPLYLQNHNNFPGWIKARGADLTRSNMRIILKHFGLPLQDIDTAVRSVNAASITDSFWIKSNGSSTRYDDVKFKTDIFANAALRGDPDIFLLSKRDSTPEITKMHMKKK